MHAYNLETNSWEEITTKPHGKTGVSLDELFFFFADSIDTNMFVIYPGHPAPRRCHSCVQIRNGDHSSFLDLGESLRSQLYI